MALARLEYSDSQAKVKSIHRQRAQRDYTSDQIQVAAQMFGPMPLELFIPAMTLLNRDDLISLTRSDWGTTYRITRAGIDAAAHLPRPVQA